MQDQSDAQLLREYIDHGREPAFTELVTRYTNLVYSAAARQMESADMAAEVTQRVFIGLAQGAQKLLPRLAENASLAGWLCRSARNISLNLRRNEFRQHNRERQAMESPDSNAEAAPEWEQLRPVLDSAMSELSEADYDALVMRFFNNRDLQSIGQALGVSDDTAQKRVARALEKLRELLSRRGVSSTAAALSLALTANAVQAAPAGLSATIATHAAISAAAIKTTSIGLTKTLVMTTLQKTLMTTAIVVAVGTGIYEAQRASQFKTQALTLQQEHDLLTDENRRLRGQSDLALSNLAAARQATQRAPESSNELMRLRAEVTRLRENTRELAQLKAASTASGTDSAMEATLKTWAARAAMLKQRLEQMPDKKIPELQLLTDREWFDAIKSGKPLETDADYRQSLKDLRNLAKVDFANMTRAALRKYLDANGGTLPPDLSQLKPYYDAPVDDAILQRYSMLQSGKLSDVPRSENLFAETAPPADPEYDSVYEFSMNGTTAWGVNDPGDIVQRGLIEYARAHQGLLPADASQLSPYLKRPVDPTRVRDILSSVPTGVTTLNQYRGVK